MLVGVDLGAASDAGTGGGGAALGQVDGLEGVEAHGVLGDRVGDALSVEQESLVAQVVDVVAGSVVVDVVGDASLAAEHLGLLLGHDALGAGEETAGGDAVQDESLVVGAAVKLGGDELGAVAGVEVLKLLLDRVGSGRARHVEGTAITVIDAVDEVGAGNLHIHHQSDATDGGGVRRAQTHHVEVEVSAHLGQLNRVVLEGINIGGRSQQTELLSTPEAETDGVLDLVLGKSLGNAQDTNGARTIVAAIVSP